ncbi:hypothetical protein AHF37_04912 [Paragonimus kellicotti]|nr:hypothetical protein AHF37_04912 [Paragonimus kellicotti]
MPRPRLRTHNRDRFLVRVLRITYQCACRPNPPVEQTKGAESRKMGCPSSECRTKKPRTYVTFQAQLPSITSSFRTCLSGNLITPATGLRLGFTCALDSEGPSLQDFANQKVAERLDAWEQGGNLPGFRCQVLSALHDTVGLMLQRIREDGFTAVTLDSDYLFYPPSSELRPANIRPRQSSASSDSSVTRIAARNLSCVETSSTDDAKERTFTTSERIEHDSTTCVDQENPVWSELVSCVETTDLARRPRTWHQVQEATDRSPSPYGLCDKQPTGLSPSESNALKQYPVALHIPGCWTSRSSPSPISCYSVSAGRTSATWTKSTDTLSPKHGPVNPDSFALSVMQRPGEVWINGRAKMLSHGRILHNDETMSTPASPTKFLNNRRLTNPRFEPNQNYSSPTTVIENPSVTRTASTTPPTATESVVGTTEQQSQLNTVLQEIANRLRTNPHLPLVLMPTHMDKGAGINEENRTGSPLIFQLPHPDSAFVCLPASLHQLPRVVCASRNGTLVVIPASNEIRMNETATDPQPTIITGPRQGYILLITADNRFDYIPITGVA